MKIGKLYDEVLGEEYPSSWNIEEFANLKSFNQRKNYCEQNLRRISSGSGRIVYQVDNEKVLKLAKNKKVLHRMKWKFNMETRGIFQALLGKLITLMTMLYGLKWNWQKG